MNEKSRRTRGADATATKRGARSVYSKIAARTAEEVSQRFDPGEAARALLRPELTPRKYLLLLMEKREVGHQTQLHITAMYKPPRGRGQMSANWRHKCEAVHRELRAYLMGRG